ncbi:MULTISPECIES: hypothetical protein [unclassified Ruegeria]|uniref:hypothetical protein n=1 Tax=unclassified Ruegeria TaxID=2625375 RepID=UPI0014893512|nr:MULTISPECIES: hypothetical protein [unclassified Ruegeria]
MSDKKKTLTRYKQVLGKLKKLRAEMNSDFERLRKENARDLQKCKKATDQKDLIAMLATMAVGLSNLAVAAKKSTKVTGAELAKLNKETLKGFVGSKADQYAQLVGGAVSDDVKADGNLVLFAKATLKAWSDMNKPSFWAAAYVDIVENRKFKWDPVSWAAYAKKIQKESDSRITRIQLKTQKDLDSRIRKYEKLVKQLERAA